LAFWSLSSYIHLDLEFSELPIRYLIGPCALYLTTITGQEVYK
jgi:hypothetical protein